MQSPGRRLVCMVTRTFASLLPPYAVYNTGGGTPENLLDYVRTLQEELVRAHILPAGYDFEGHRELTGM